MGIVCDGMGGHFFGEVAREKVCDAISRYELDNTDPLGCETKVAMACKKACNAIKQKSYDLSYVAMGSMMAMVSIEVDKATIAHVGDSRCYLQRQSEGCFTKLKFMYVSTSGGKFCHAVSLVTTRSRCSRHQAVHHSKKETGSYSVLMVCSKAWHPTFCKQGCLTTNHWKKFSMSLTASAENNVMTTIRQYRLK